MDDYLSIDVQLKSDFKSTLDQVKENFPDFKWRGGDSDQSGRHIHGTNPGEVDIQIWVEDNPPCICISFNDAWTDLVDREERKTEFYKSALVKLEQIFIVGKTEALISLPKGVKF